MPESLTAKIESSIGGAEDQIDPLEYLKVLLDNWRAVGSQLRRGAVSLFVLIAIFELMFRAGETGWVFLGLEVADLTLPLIGIPFVATLVTFEILSAIGGTLRYRHVYQSVVRVHYRKLYDFDLELPLAPPQLIFGQTMHASVAAAPKWMIACANWGLSGMFVVLVMLPAFFVLYALWVLWSQIGMNFVLLASTLLSVIAIIISYSTLFAEVYFE